MAEASFTFEDASIATKVKSIKVEGAKLEIIFEWEIQGTPGESKLTGELAGDKLQGTYASKTASSNSNGTWTATRS